MEKGRNFAPNGIAALILMAHLGFLVASANQHGPTELEPSFLASGLAHWRFQRFEPYRVNPPLPRMIAALPVLVLGYRDKWPPLEFDDPKSPRWEHLAGSLFFDVNSSRSQELLTWARRTSALFSVIGGLFAYAWAKELYGAAAGLVTLVLLCFDPNLLAHAELVTPDCACWSMGLGAGFCFWSWLRRPSWKRACVAGVMLGMAQLTKSSWIILYGVWPLLCLTWVWLSPNRKRQSAYPFSSESVRIRPLPDPTSTDSERRPRVAQFVGILLLSVYVMNVAYAFDGFGTKLGDFSFVSKSLAGDDTSGAFGNRFGDTMLAWIPIPFPRQYVLGIDRQKRDFEGFSQKSYLRGEWKKGGWWYYYIYGLLVKLPLGTWGLILYVIISRLRRRSAGLPLRDELVILLPAFALFLLVSSQTGFNIHLRYVFPSVALIFVFLGQAGQCLEPNRSAERSCALPT